MKRYALRVEQDAVSGKWVVHMKFTLNQLVNLLGGDEAVAMLCIGDDEFEIHLGRDLIE